jgi:hypothetical protein
MQTKNTDEVVTKQEKREKRRRNRRKMAMHGRGTRKSPRPVAKRQKN